MAELYRLNGSNPAPLPVEVIDPDTGFGFRAPFDDGQLNQLGYQLAPPKPADTKAQTAEWDGHAEAWAMVDRPAPPTREPNSVTLGRLQFIVLAQTAGGMTDAMLVEARDNPAFAAFWIKYQMAEAVERDDPITRGSLDALAAGGYLPKGKAAVIAAWPTV